MKLDLEICLMEEEPYCYQRNNMLFRFHYMLGWGINKYTKLYIMRVIHTPLIKQAQKNKYFDIR